MQNKFENLNKIDTFLEKSASQGKKENLHSSITIKETESRTKNLPTKNQMVLLKRSRYYNLTKTLSEKR